MEVSVWQRRLPDLPSFPTLCGDLKCEAAVVGAGMTGLLTAFALRNAGINTVVLESRLPGSGTTGVSPAQITLQNGLLFRHLLDSLGLDLARRYLRQQQDAIDAFEELVKRLSISCGFRRIPAYLFHSRSAQSLQREWEAIRLTGIPASRVTETELPFPVSEALCLPNQAVFHPLQFLYALVPHLHIFAHSPVQRIQNGVLYTPHGRIRAKHIVVTAHLPGISLPDRHVQRLRQQHICLLALEGVPPLTGLYRDLSCSGLSLRPCVDGALLSGAPHKQALSTVHGRFQALHRQAEEWWPNCRVTALWTCRDWFTREGIPYVGAYGGARADLYVAAGFSGFGMAAAMTASRFISHRISEKR